MVADFGFRRHFAPVSVESAWDGFTPKDPAKDAPDANVEGRAAVAIAAGNYERNDTVVDSMLDAVLDALM